MSNNFPNFKEKVNSAIRQFMEYMTSKIAGDVLNIIAQAGKPITTHEIIKLSPKKVLRTYKNRETLLQNEAKLYAKEVSRINRILSSLSRVKLLDATRMAGTTELFYSINQSAYDFLCEIQSAYAKIEVQRSTRKRKNLNPNAV